MKQKPLKIKITTELIRSFNPCASRLDNWEKHYDSFTGDLVEFLDLEHITHKEKLWVAMRVLPRFLVEVFAIDCAVDAAYSAADAAADADAAPDAAYSAADAAAYYAADAEAAISAAYAATTAAYYAAAADADAAYYAAVEEKRQIESLIYLIQNQE